MNKPYSKDFVRSVIDKTVMNKCNRRYPFKTEVSSTDTIYGYFRKMYL